MLEAVLILIAVILGALRIFGCKSLLFQGIAHIFVGGLFGAAFTSQTRSRFYLELAVGLTILEVICFLAGKFGF